jgi:SAM-dependent methyltransferase
MVLRAGDPTHPHDVEDASARYRCGRLPAPLSRLTRHSVRPVGGRTTGREEISEASVMKRFSGDRWHLILELIGADTESVLDIGCRDRALAQYLPPGSSYVGLDVSPPADVVANADEPLPFADDSFASVVLADVLEHLNDPHAALHEATRVARTAVVVLLPNVYSLYYRVRFLTGVMPGDKYIFGPELRVDRHRWMVNFHQAVSFTHGRARAVGWCVTSQYAYDRPFRRPVARLGYWAARMLASPNVWAWEYAARLEPAHEDEV